MTLKFKKVIYICALHVFPIICFAQSNYTESNVTKACSIQPIKTSKIVPIILTNYNISTCTTTNTSNYSEITSTHSINIKGTQYSPVGSRFSGTVVHFAIKTPYEDAFIKAERQLITSFVPVINNIGIHYIEEYLDSNNEDPYYLNYSIYTYKNDPNTYSKDFFPVLINRGDNYITIPVNTLPKGFYTIEIVDPKGTSYFVKFQKI